MLWVPTQNGEQSTVWRNWWKGFTEKVMFELRLDRLDGVCWSKAKPRRERTHPRWRAGGTWWEVCVGEAAEESRVCSGRVYLMWCMGTYREAYASAAWETCNSSDINTLEVSVSCWEEASLQPVLQLRGSSVSKMAPPGIMKPRTQALITDTFINSWPGAECKALSSCYMSVKTKLGHQGFFQ